MQLLESIRWEVLLGGGAVTEVDVVTLQHQYHTKIDEFIEKISHEMIRSFVEKVGTCVDTPESDGFGDGSN